jgi:hypothetical protein
MLPERTLDMEMDLREESSARPYYRRDRVESIRNLTGISRCDNLNHPNKPVSLRYGPDGITLCKPWFMVEKFRPGVCRGGNGSRGG